MTTDLKAFNDIREWIYDQSGIIFPDHKKDLLRQRLSRVNTSYHLAGVEELYERLKDADDKKLQLDVLHAATTNHTYFFREPEVLDSLMTKILPKFQDRPLIKIWSAAASTGDEAYSLAILIAEKLGEAGLNKLDILGTDISSEVVRRAEEGIYSHRQFDRTAPELLRKYFKPVEEGYYQVSPNIKRACTFRRMNLKAIPYPFQSKFPIILCRNVFYYFDKKDQIDVLEGLYNVTEPGGYLLTSVTESVRNLPSRWQPVETGIFRRPE